MRLVIAVALTVSAATVAAEQQSDSYATGLVVFALKQAGVAPDHTAIRKGIRWLETNQQATSLPDVPGRAWHSHSLNYDREHGGEKGEP